MTIFDYATIVIVVLSMFLGLIRGFVFEVFCILGWVGGIIAAFFLFQFPSMLLTSWIQTAWVRSTVSGILVFLVTYFLIIYAVRIITKKIVIYNFYIGILDQTFGIAFGFLRGLVICALFQIFLQWLVPQSIQRPNWLLNKRFRPLLGKVEVIISKLDTSFRNTKFIKKTSLKKDE